MNPNELCQCNHNEKGMIFPKDKVAELLNLEPMGKSQVSVVKPNLVVTHPFDLLTFPCLN